MSNAANPRMTPRDLRQFPEFAHLPLYEENDERCESLLRPQDGSTVREATTQDEVRELLADPSLKPVGAIIYCGDDGKRSVYGYLHGGKA